MNFERTEAENALAKAIRELEAPETTREWFARLGQAGYLECGIGHRERSESLALLTAQVELAGRVPWLVFAAEMHRLVLELTAAHGSDSLIEQHLPAMKSGERIAAAAFTEHARGTVADQLGTRAEPSKAGYSLTGAKDLVSLANKADTLAVLAATPGGPAILLLDRTAPGIAVGEPIDALGHRPLETCPVRFEAVEVPADRVIGPLTDEQVTDSGEDLRWAEDRAVTAMALGICSLSVEEAKRAASEPRQAGKPPAGYQAVRFQLAEMLTLTQTAELLAQRAAAAVAGQEAATLALCAKVFATEAACRVSDQALSILASSGFRQDHPVARALIEARFCTMVGHSSNVARMAIADDALSRFSQ